MAYSTQRVTSDGTLWVLPLSIEFFEKEDIYVFVNEVPQTVNVGYEWLTDTSIRFLPSALPAGTEVLIRRETDKSEPRHIFSRGSPFTNSAIDEDFRQVLHIAQEAIEGSNVGDIYTTLNMHGNRILNVGPAVDDGDAVPFSQYKADAMGAYQSRQAAAASAAAAAASQQSAWGNEQQTYQHRLAAEGARDVALAARDQAVVAKDASISSSNDSREYARQAKLWATFTGAPVEGGLWSAKAYAETAGASATTATTQADRAKTEADKLGNWNGLAGTVEVVYGTVNVAWKGEQITRGSIIRSADGANTPYLRFEGIGGNQLAMLSTDVSAGGLYMQNSVGTRVFGIANSGTLSTQAVVASGEIISKFGSVSSWASGAGTNAHIWLRSSTGEERALIYADAANKMYFRCAQSGNSWVLDTAGTLTAVSTGAKILQNGNIAAPIWGPNGLHNVVWNMARGVSRRMVDSLIWQGSTAGNGSVITLSEDARNFVSFTTDYAGSGVRGFVTGLRELANLPAGTVMFVSWSPNTWVRCKFNDTGDTRTLLHTMEFVTNSGFSKLYGHREAALL